MRCGETLTAAQAELVRRLRRKAGPGYVCLPADKNAPPAETTNAARVRGQLMNASWLLFFLSVLAGYAFARAQLHVIAARKLLREAGEIHAKAMQEFARWQIARIEAEREREQ